MKIDDDCVNIIKIFYNLNDGEEISLSGIREKIFFNLSKKQKLKKLIFIRDRLFAMSEDIFEVIKNEDTWEYKLKTDNVFFKIFSFPDRRKKGMALKIKEKWIVHEL